MPVPQQGCGTSFLQAVEENRAADSCTSKEVKAVLRTSPDLFENATELLNGQGLFQ
jgi:hypothetical protein